MKEPADLGRLVVALREGDRTALARAISLVENESAGYRAVLESLVREPPTAARVGITGPPGAGKSTVVARLARRLGEQGHAVGVLAVDPTSPYTGGALLGDRIRVAELSPNSQVFMRSMATRGGSYTLGAASKDVLDLMDGFGFDWLLAETVGAGQSDTDIADLVDTVVLLMVPESGDAVQTLKAGLLEAADVLVVNKTDRAGADLIASDLREMLELRTPGVAREQGEPVGAGWEPPVVQTNARADEGIDGLLEAIRRHRTHLEDSGELARRRGRRVVGHVRDLLARELGRRAEALTSASEWREETMERIASGAATPWSVVEELLGRLGLQAGWDEIS